MHYADETVITPASRMGFRQLIKDVWDYREVFLSFMNRDIKIRYKQTALGAFWVIIQPLFTTGAFALIFGKIANMPTDGLPYSLFYFAAMVPWGEFSRGVSGGATCIEGNVALVTKIYFPRVVIPAAVLCSGFVDFLAGWLVFVIFVVKMGYWHWQLLAMTPLLVLLTAGSSLGLGLVLGALNAQYRDVKNAIGFIVQMMMLATPVIYPSSVLPVWARPWLFLNPMATVINAYRVCLRGGGFDWVQIGLSGLVTFVALVFGLWFFRKREGRFADIL